MKTLLLSFLLLPVCLKAQPALDGLWEGTMTVGGLYSDQALPMQLYLTIRGQQVTGRSYVTLPNGNILRMDLQGYLYHDRSLALAEINFVGDSDNDVIPEFSRQYQIVYKPDLWDSTLKGFWQEMSTEHLGKDRRLGRIVLRKQKQERA
ncbi:hypothetical protein GGR26_000751 [Lewinella marina]|uniref:Uncharacterized protein n=1 Tax=Neolewinella marina TaxID=438751 RepID=A0A2G0CIN6_9BACT|nr:hypothetical protein [Neolewinella marina]NJB85006.1 hypothetical protein [Neolewinella marina]PHK99844.1 hypothetical protein CGL56_02025 [Neolewinella marina]